MCFHLCQIGQEKLRDSLLPVRRERKTGGGGGRGEENQREGGGGGRAGREGETLVKIFLEHRTNSVHLGFGELDNILCTAPK